MAISVSRVFYMVPEPPPESENDKHDSSDDDLQRPLFDLSAGSSHSCLTILHQYNCLVNILEFLSFHDMNNFSAVSKECYNVRSDKTLDQTRAGTIYLGKGVRSIVELMLKTREQEWHRAFRGNRTHLHLSGLNCLSSDIEMIDDEFIAQCSPLKHVTSLDCSEVYKQGKNYKNFIRSGRRDGNSESGDRDEGSSYSSEEAHEIGNARRLSPQTSWMFRYQDYIDKGFAHGLALSLLVPNLRQIDMSYLPLTSLGVAWIAENNTKLECIRWNRSLIWPINHPAHDILRACRNLKELYIDDSRLLFGPNGHRHRWRRNNRRQRRQRDRNDGGNDDEDDEDGDENGDSDTEAMWSSLTENIQSLVRVSCLRVRWYNQNSRFTAIGETEKGQASLMRFVRLANDLEWFRSDLSDDNIAILKEERPGVVFCR